MKKYLAVIVFILSGIAAKAQTLTLSDITNLATLNTAQAHASLTMQRPFQETYTEQVNGRTVSHYAGNTAESKCESVVIGYQALSSSGQVLRTVTYDATNTKYILKLIIQAKGIGLNKEFQGADTNGSIYLFDNFMYTVNIYISNDHSKGGSIVVKQNLLQ